MRVHISLPSQLAALAGGADVVDVAGSTVAEALAELVALHPDLGDRLFADGRLNRVVNVYLGDDDIRLLEGLETPLTDGAELTLLPAIAGGASGRPRR